MELKDVILSTLAEMENELPQTEEIAKKESQAHATFQEIQQNDELQNQKRPKQEYSSIESELSYLKSIRERLLVLFEGFQAPNNANIEAKIDMTLNFLEYMLATIDNRVENLEKEEDVS
jgi:hypothetical protein